MEKKKKMTLRRHTLRPKKQVKIKITPRNSLQKEIPVLGREHEYQLIKKQLDTFIEFGNNSILYLTGVPGSGKTHTTFQLIKTYKLPYIYINCSVLKAKVEIYRKICDELQCFSGFGTLQTLRHHCNTCKKKHLIIIDEVDFLITTNQCILYNIFELPFIDNSKVFMIVISNTLGSFSSKVESRIGNCRIEFRPYTSDQLLSIVKNDTEMKGLKVDHESLELLSKRVAATTGDIRNILNVIEEVEELDIKKTSTILKDMTSPLLDKFVISLSFYQKLVLSLNTHPLKSIMEWFNDFKSFCLVKGYNALDFADFLYVVNDLISFDIYKMRKDKVYVACNYLKEEIELAMKKDRDFDKFKLGKLS
ncbi:Origin recognition complex [Glugoides intestinalis]